MSHHPAELELLRRQRPSLRGGFRLARPDGRGSLEPVKILASRRFSVLLIVSMASACDNVEWGGIEVRRQGPPATSVGAVPDTAGARQDSLELLPTGPVLYM